MEEYKFNSQSSYSEAGERSGSTPITVAFRSEKATPIVSKKKSGGKVWQILTAGLLVVGISFGSGALGASLFGKDAAPEQPTVSLSSNTDATAQASLGNRFNTPASTAVQPVIPTPTETSYAEIAAPPNPPTERSSPTITSLTAQHESPCV